MAPNNETLYTQHLVQNILEREKRAGAASAVKDFFGRVGGKNVEKALADEYIKVMGVPHVAEQAVMSPKRMGAFQTYVKNMLRGNVSKRGIALDASKKKRKAIIDALASGRNNVKAQQTSTRNARLALGGGLAVPAAGVGTAAALSKESASIDPDEILRRIGIKDEPSDLIPAAGGAAVGASPIVEGLRPGGALRNFPEPASKAVTDVSKIRELIRPGDIILTSGPGHTSHFKPMVSAVGGSPYGYHVETAIKAKKGAGPYKFIDSHPRTGGATARWKASLDPGEDIMIKRLKDSSQVKPFLKNLKKMKKSEDLLAKLLGEEARPAMYDKGTAVSGGLRSLIPSPLRKLIPSKKPMAGSTVCSSLPGMACPVNLAPGVAKHEILPHHLQRSAALETVGHYRAPRTAKQKAYEMLMHASPWAVRGLVGAGLGYGAYKGLQALRDWK